MFTLNDMTRRSVTDYVSRFQNGSRAALPSAVRIESLPERNRTLIFIHAIKRLIIEIEVYRLQFGDGPGSTELARAVEVLKAAHLTVSRGATDDDRGRRYRHPGADHC